jgi:hypothetical protein
MKVSYKVNYFKLIVCSLGLATLISCNTNKPVFKPILDTTSAAGVGTRGLGNFRGSVLVAGIDGNVSVHRLDSLNFGISKGQKIDGIEDFRDVYCNTMGACLLMNSGKNGKISGISPSGIPRSVYDTSGVFFNGMDFWASDQNGMVFGDPVNNRFFLAVTGNQGRNWMPLQPLTMPEILKNEAGFAASGSSIQAIGDSSVYFGTGMAETARLFKTSDRGINWVAKDTPMKAGNFYGIYSIFFWSQNEGMIIGGSYVDSTYNDKICFTTSDGGDTWTQTSKGLRGYCSSVCGTPDGKLIFATGTQGTFYTTDKGANWELLTERPFYSCLIIDNKLALTGNGGEVLVYEYSFPIK